jgi:Fervidolysin N-terminal prodomain
MNTNNNELEMQSIVPSVLAVLSLFAAFSAAPALAGTQTEILPAPAEPVIEEGIAMDETAPARDFRILVRFDDAMAATEIDSINTRLGVRVVDRLLGGRIYVVEVAYAETRDQIIAAYEATEGVVYAEPDQELSIPEPPGPAEGGVEDTTPVIPLPKVE